MRHLTLLPRRGAGWIPAFAGMTLVLFLLFSPASAYAACSTPAGVEGEVVYNQDFKIVQFCDATNWIKLGGTTLDARIGTLTATKWCAANAGGTAIDCTQDAPAATAGATKQVIFNDAGALAGAANLLWLKTFNTNAGGLRIGSTVDPAATLDVTGTAAISGATTLGSTLGVTGDVAVNTNKFNVTAASGNTTIAGTLGVTGAASLTSTLGVTGDVAVNTNKFNVTAASGNTTIAGTLGVTGAASLTSTLGVAGATPVAGTALEVANTGYAQFNKAAAGAPTGTDCDAANETGRIYLDTTGSAQKIYMCTGTTGWMYTNVGTTGGISSQWVTTGSDIYYNTGKVGIGTAGPVSALHVSGTTALNWGTSASLGLVTIGTSGSGSSLYMHTPSLNASYASGFGVDGTYGSQTSVINLQALGVKSAGGYGSAMAFSTTNNTTLTERMRIDKDGNIGIGTATPGSKLTVSANAAAALPAPNSGTLLHLGNADDASTNILVDSYGTGTPNFSFRKANGTGASGGQTALALNDNMGQMTWNGYGASAYNTGSAAKIVVFASEAWTGSTQATYMAFFTRPSNVITASTERMRIDKDGNVGIGGTPNASALLDVASTATPYRGFLPPRMTTTNRDAITSPAAGLTIYNTTNNQLEFYSGSAWSGIGSTTTGQIAAFALSSCPSGWTEYTAARGRFLRGIDPTGATVDPSGTRAPGNQQADAFQGFKPQFQSTGTYDAASLPGGVTYPVPGYGGGVAQLPLWYLVSDGTNGTPRIANETRPKNVAVIFCQYSGTGNVAPATATVSGTTNYVAKFTAATVLGDSQIIDNGTNVGIGVTPAAKLDVLGGAAGTTLAVTGSTIDPTTVMRIGRGTVSALDIGVLDNGTAYLTNHDKANFATIYNIAIAPSGGNVGIGVIAPAYKLDVNGTIHTAASSPIATGGSLASGYFDWGQISTASLQANDLDLTRPGQPMPVYRMNWHYGLSFSAHTAYGGIRFYNQGYSGGDANGALKSTIGAVLVADVMSDTFNVRTKLGIGSPASVTYPLDVVGNARLAGATHTYLYINAPSAATEAGLLFQEAGVNKWELYKSGGNVFSLYNFANAKSVLIVAANGDTTITGSVSTCTIGNGTGATNCTSDRRLKKDITPISGALDKLLQINGVSFHWKDPAKSAAEHIGVIAQDVEAVFPQAIGEVDDATLGKAKTVDIAVLVSPIIEALRELKHMFDGLAAKVETVIARITGVEERMNTLEAENTALKARLDALEEKVNASPVVH